MSSKDMIKPIIVLSIICLVLSGALALTNNVTAPIIEASEKAAAEAARAEVLPAADGFTQVDGTFGDSVVGVYAADNGAGYVVQILRDGYGGKNTLSVMVGIDSEGLISATKVMAHKETPGLGSRVSEPEFGSQFVGKDASLAGVETISGATISSGHFINAVKEAFAAYETAKGVN